VLKKFRDAPMCWGPGIPACANYWIRGVCAAKSVPVKHPISPWGTTRISFMHSS
jgi:hypothetical protein